MPAETIRIFSDIHFGDRASQVRDVKQLAPLFSGATAVVLNGDTLDTREGPNPAHTAATREAVLAFVSDTRVPTRFHTGNHDPDVSSTHWSDFAGGRVFVVHGDVLFDDIVPWGQDAPEIRAKVAAALREHGFESVADIPLAERMAIWREVARSIPQRHQSERDPLKYAWHFLADTVWPPTRFLKIFRAWHREPRLAANLTARDHLAARYVVVGHTHRPAIRRHGTGPIVINTGSFTAPFGGAVVEIAGDSLTVRRIKRQGRDFHPGPVLAEFPLAKG